MLYNCKLNSLLSALAQGAISNLILPSNRNQVPSSGKFLVQFDHNLDHRLRLQVSTKNWFWKRKWNKNGTTKSGDIFVALYYMKTKYKPALTHNIHVSCLIIENGDNDFREREREKERERERVRDLIYITVNTNIKQIHVLFNPYLWSCLSFPDSTLTITRSLVHMTGFCYRHYKCPLILALVITSTRHPYPGRKREARAKCVRQGGRKRGAGCC